MLFLAFKQGCGFVEAIEYFCFGFQLRIKLVASKFASASNFFLQTASAFTTI